MKFTINRATYTEVNEPPCEGAKKELITYPSGASISEWVIEINTLEEFIKLSEDTGFDLVMVNNSVIKGIIIYDGYLE